MLCRLCVTQCADAKKLFDENDQCNEFYQITENYFDVNKMLSENNKQDIAICMICWGHIFGFYNFQKFVFEAQRRVTGICENKNKCGGDGDINTKHPKVCDLEEEAGNSHVSPYSPESIEKASSDIEVHSQIEEEKSGSLLSPQSAGSREKASSDIEFHCLDEEETGNSHVSPHSPDSKKKASSDIEFHCQDTNETVEILSSEEFESTDDCSMGIDLPDSDSQEEGKESTTSQCREHHKATEQDSCLRYSPTDFEDIDDNTIIAQWKSELECRICGREFLLFQLLRNHFREDHPLAKFYVLCCNRKFFYRCKLAEHIRCHMNPYPFKCKICNRRFTRKANLISHSHEHQHKIKKVKEVNSIIKLNERMQTSANAVNEIEVKTASNDEMKVQASMVLKDNNKLQEDDAVIAQWQKFLLCQVCSASYPSFTSLRNHFRQAHPKEKLHIQCCGRKFKYQSSFKDHVKRHIDPHPFKCTICAKGYSQRANLITHIQDAHNQMQKRTLQTLDELLGQWSQKLECDICCQPFVSITLLRHHFRYKHPKKAFYVLCCGSKLKRRWEIESHIRSHLNEVVSVFTCKQCDKSFSSQTALERHQSKSHHNNSVDDYGLKMCTY